MAALFTSKISVKSRSCPLIPFFPKPDNNCSAVSNIKTCKFLFQHMFPKHSRVDYCYPDIFPCKLISSILHRKKTGDHPHSVQDKKQSLWFSAYSISGSVITSHTSWPGTRRIASWLKRYVLETSANPTFSSSVHFLVSSGTESVRFSRFSAFWSSLSIFYSTSA